MTLHHSLRSWWPLGTALVIIMLASVHPASLKGNPSVVCASANCVPKDTPPLNGDSWPSAAAKWVYIDPKLPNQDVINQAIKDFAAESGQNVAAYPSSVPVAGATAYNAIGFFNNPSGSPNAFAHTQDTNTYTNGVNTHKIAYVTTNFNFGALIPGTTNTPEYSASQPGAAQFIHDVVLHELSHAFGITDFPAGQTPDAQSSVMADATGTNDQGPHLDASGNVVQGGTRSHTVTSCDKSQITTANPASATPPSSGGGSGGGGSSGGGGGNPGGGGGTTPCGDEWDDESNTITSC